MHKPLHSFVFSIEYTAASLLVMAGVWALLLISSAVPDADETSFLNPVLDRIDFLNIQDVSLDAVFAIRQPEKPDLAIKVVNIGEVAPAPDGKIAMLLRKLHTLGARVIGVDVIFDSSHVERFPPDRIEEIEMLRAALQEVPNVVIANGFEAATNLPAWNIDPRIAAVSPHRGFVNLVPDADGVVRRFLPWNTVKGQRWLSFPVMMMQLYDSTKLKHVLSLPDEAQIIAYTGTYFEFESVPIDDVLFSERYDDGYFANSIVLVGFVNEGGLFYLGDTHRTPMGHKLGIVGPDMPGVLIHANVVDMLLRDRFIMPVPAWMDWLLVFLLSYFSLAVYRVLRTRPSGQFGAVVLVTAMLFFEAVLVFFIPLIGFFYFGVKISYNLMATAVLLFIPAGSVTSWLRVRLLHQSLRYRLKDSTSPLAPVLRHTFMDDEEFALRVRLEHGCLYLLHAALSIRLSERRQSGADLPEGVRMPDLSVFRALLPAIARVCDDAEPSARDQQQFYQYLLQRKSELLRDARVKNELFMAHLDAHNPHLEWEEWDALLPHALRLWRQDLTDEIQRIRGIRGNGILGSASPFMISAQCKVHGEHEVFVYAGMVRRQSKLMLTPAYYGVDVQCEPLLDAETQIALQSVGLLQFIDQQREVQQ